jgi:hypothetical protein
MADVYIITVSRSERSHTKLVIEAESQFAAETLALKQAGHLSDFGDLSSETVYEVEDVVKV